MSIPANHPAIQEARRRGLIQGDESNPKPRPPAPLPTPVKLTLGVWIAGLVPVSEANTGGGLRGKLRRKAAVKAAVREALARLSPLEVRLPVAVTLHRCGWRLLDDDNLANAYKAVRDVVAEWLGCDDGDTDAVSWAYSQDTASPKGSYITVEEL